jgi:hypothetical protein
VDTLIPVDAATPRSLVLDPPLTDVQFQQLCFANDWFRFERTREGAAAVSSKTVQGSGPVEGFTLDLDEVWRCYEI